jgi:hypothetical protein
MKARVLLVAEIDVPGRNPDAEIQDKLDAFREAVLASENYGLTISRISKRDHADEDLATLFESGWETFSDGEPGEWECPECGNVAHPSVDDLKAVGTPYCADCDCEMEEVVERATG